MATIANVHNLRRAVRAAQKADRAVATAQAAQLARAYADDAARRDALRTRLASMAEGSPAVRAAVAYWTARATYCLKSWQAACTEAGESDVCAHMLADSDMGRSTVREALRVAALTRADDGAWHDSDVAQYGKHLSSGVRARLAALRARLAADPLAEREAPPPRPVHCDSALGLVAVVLAATEYADYLPAWIAPWRLAETADGASGVLSLALPAAPAVPVLPESVEATKATKAALKAVAKLG